MLIGYARVSKADGSQSLGLQRDEMQAAGVDTGHVYHDFHVRRRRAIGLLWGFEGGGRSDQSATLVESAETRVSAP